VQVGVVYFEAWAGTIAIDAGRDCNANLGRRVMTLGRRRRAEHDSLGERLRARRREKGLTQEQLAEHAQTTQAVIQKIENGKSLRPRKIDKIAGALDVKAAWLMFGNDRFDELDGEAMEIATAWAGLEDNLKAEIRERIMAAA
jgi:transcriptional regulator with XRE-family HTH domain